MFLTFGTQGLGTMDETKIVLNMGKQALSLSEQQEEMNLGYMIRVAELIKAASSFLCDMVSDYGQLVELTDTLRYLNAD